MKLRDNLRDVVSSFLGGETSSDSTERLSEEFYTELQGDLNNLFTSNGTKFRKSTTTNLKLLYKEKVLGVEGINGLASYGNRDLVGERENDPWREDPLETGKTIDEKIEIKSQRLSDDLEIRNDSELIFNIGDAQELYEEAVDTGDKNYVNEEFERDAVANEVYRATAAIETTVRDHLMNQEELHLRKDSDNVMTTKATAPAALHGILNTLDDEIRAKEGFAEGFAAAVVDRYWDEKMIREAAEAQVGESAGKDQYVDSLIKEYGLSDVDSDYEF